MKSILCLALVFASAAVNVSGTPVRRFGGKGAGQGQFGQGKGGKGAAAASTTAAAAASTDAAAAASTTDAAAAAAASSTDAAAASSADSDPQTSLTLDPQVIASGFAQNGLGLNTSEAGEVASLTSTNNFINFCVETISQFPITNGQQITTGSCNPAPIGLMVPKSSMPSANFVNPANLDVIPANENFTIQMAISNLDTGFFVNADTNFMSAPQQLNGQGVVQGHSHVVIESITSLTSTSVTDPSTFTFFKGLNDAAVGGILTAEVAGGVPAGTYRLCSINTDANHTPVAVSVAQHGALDGCVFFTASDNASAASSGAAAADTASTAAAADTSSTAAADAEASTTAAAAAATSSAAAATGAGAGKGKGGKGKGKFAKQ